MKSLNITRFLDSAMETAMLKTKEMFEDRFEEVLTKVSERD